MQHTPVLLKEVIKFLDPRPGEFIIDGTIDGGGHATAILEKITSRGIFLGLDWDKNILDSARKRIAEIRNSKSEILNTKIVLEQGNYADLPDILKRQKLPKADGLLLDLGFSSEQLESSGRGFSFEKDEPLIMTYSEERHPVAQILRELKENDLADVIFQFGGERMSRRIAKAIKERGKRKPIMTSGELAEIVRSAVPKSYERGRIDPSTRTFQALRIYANDELKNLEMALQNLPNVLKTGGRAVIISFHSLEDKLVKNYFRDYAKAGKMEILTKKPITVCEEEIRANARSRSAKLRCAQFTRSAANT
ncbi:MAG: 16S rRNA (cytosine(1402)-N(4))-methyltransferase RsmH [Patescibacteria group bacterium]